MLQVGLVALVIRCVAFDNEGARDLYFRETATRAVAAQMPWAPYVFFNPKAATPQQHATELDRALAQIGSLPTLPTMIDCEEYSNRPGEQPIIYGSDYAQELGNLTTLVQRITGRAPTIYTNDSWWNPKIQSSDFGHLDLVGPRYLRTSAGQIIQPPLAPALWADFAMAWASLHPPQGPETPTGWSDWTCWQFAADGNGVGRHIGCESVDCPIDLIRASKFQEWFPGPWL